MQDSVWHLHICVVGLPRLKFMVAGLGWRSSLLQLFGTWGGGVPVCTALSLSFSEGASFNISWILRSIPLDVTVIWDIPVTRHPCKHHRPLQTQIPPRKNWILFASDIIEKYMCSSFFLYILLRLLKHQVNTRLPINNPRNCDHYPKMEHCATFMKTRQRFSKLRATYNW